MTTQYLRTAYISIFDGDVVNSQTGTRKTGPQLKLDDMHVQFHVWSATTHTMKHAVIRVWNLSATSALRALKEFRRVDLAAGYGNGAQTIFSGQIARVEIGKDNAVDSYVDIHAQDGDQGMNWAVMNKTLAKGWTDDDVYRQCMSSFAEYGISQGYKPEFQLRPAPRGNVLNGPTRNIMDTVAANQECDWYVEDGAVNMVPKTAYRPGPIPSLAPDSGLIGVPRLTFNGIECTCLLRPEIRVGCAVMIDNRAITQMHQYFPQMNIDDLGANVPGLSPTGTYKTYCVEHIGDNRGEEWYTRFIGVAVDATGPAKGSPVFDSVPQGV